MARARGAEELEQVRRLAEEESTKLREVLQEERESAQATLQARKSEWESSKAELEHAIRELEGRLEGDVTEAVATIRRRADTECAKLQAELEEERESAQATLREREGEWETQKAELGEAIRELEGRLRRSRSRGRTPAIGGSLSTAWPRCRHQGRTAPESEHAPRRR